MKYIIIICLLLSTSAAAMGVGEKLSDPALELRAREISRQLRCVVCQNETIDESNAGIASDMRRAVRERIMAGDNDEKIIEFMRSRYGEFVLLKPVMAGGNLLLWFAPFLVLIIGMAVVARLKFKRPQDLS